jgi:hypothetical protein
LNYPISFKFNFKMFMKHCCDFSVTFLFWAKKKSYEKYFILFPVLSLKCKY